MVLSVGFEGNITSAIKFTDLASFIFATWQMRSYFVNVSPQSTVIGLFAIFRVFLVDLGNREITTLLKVAVDSVTLELCGSRDYFDSSLLVKKSDLIVTLKREGFCL